MNRRSFLLSIAAMATVGVSVAPTVEASPIETPATPAQPESKIIALASVPVFVRPSYIQSMQTQVNDNFRVYFENSNFASKYDPLGMYGFFSAKVRCTECLQQYGVWSKFVSDSHLVPVPGDAFMGDIARSATGYFKDSGFNVTGGPPNTYAFTCGHCNGNPLRMVPLIEAVPPVNYFGWNIKELLINTFQAKEAHQTYNNTWEVRV
jgi:hypothetical protein